MIGGRLQTLRKLRRLTQAEAAKKMGVVRSTYANYESGKREPDFDTTQIMANFYKVSVDYLLGRTEDPNKVVKEELEGLSEHRKKAIEEIWKMNEDEVNYFYDLMKRIKK